MRENSQDGTMWLGSRDDVLTIKSLLLSDSWESGIFLSIWNFYVPTRVNFIAWEARILALNQLEMRGCKISCGCYILRR